jgi:purine nucleosidase/pyrimidine-specific ribonucleoside hydrolase
MPRKIILDCDPGHDDAVAILLAHATPEVELLAITTVAGNQTLEKTTLNARRICTLAGITDVPIAAGSSQPLVRDLRVAHDIHGESGLDGPTFGEPTVPVDDRHAVDLIVELVRTHAGEVTIVPVGPLTNVAAALQRDPGLAALIPEIVFMGGSTGRGNTTPLAEFNIFDDPEAAQLVLDAEIPMTMIGLNLTHQALATPAVIDRIASLGTPVAVAVRDLMTFFAAAYDNVFGLADPPVHDPCAVACVARPELVRSQDAFVAVETQGRWTAGATVVDLHGVLGHEPNVSVALELDVDGFWDLVVEALATYR